MFNQDVIAAVKAAKFCRVVIYPAVRGWCGERMQLGGGRRIDALGHPTSSVAQGIGWCKARRRSEWRRKLHG